MIIGNWNKNIWNVAKLWRVYERAAYKIRGATRRKWKGKSVIWFRFSHVQTYAVCLYEYDPNNKSLKGYLLHMNVECFYFYGKQVRNNSWILLGKLNIQLFFDTWNLCSRFTWCILIHTHYCKIELLLELVMALNSIKV